MGLNFIRIAVIYLVIGTSLGIAMGISQRFTLIPVHAHVLLLGWATLAIAGVVYQLYPMAANTRLARIHFWLHNLGLPVFMAALALLLSGHESVLPLVAIAALVVLLGLVLFAANFLLTTRTAA
jgi:cbb3-type cytochrome oxidase subunit 1